MFVEQTALMQACQYSHWKVVLTLVLFKANMHRADYLNGGTALHLATLNRHSRCIRILLADYIPNVPNFCNILNKRSRTEESILEFDRSDVVELCWWLVMLWSYAGSGAGDVRVKTSPGYVGGYSVLCWWLSKGHTSRGNSYY
ncbi:hypothetical protein POM88_021361 [Heracleum sosnowskyi]|uniref:Uncharacterized protein n=1 Tax=Heracleum sosnowskyi TaxID=360622 RepID=A0AAD8MSE6_9APIA|nr:hypothetical protein POM88_021361 [Heracleum sosnowskyi]